MSRTLIPNLTYRVVRMPCEPGADVTIPNQTVYVAMAWNYDYGQLIVTRPHSSYTVARVELNEMVAERNCALRYWDGEYQVAGDGEQIVRVETETLGGKLEQELAHRA